MRTLIAVDPYTELDEGKVWIERGKWPCKWLTCPDAGKPPFVTAYRLRFAMANDAVVRAHVSADERYELFLDGKRIGRGSERGDDENWFYETYDLRLDAGEHVIVARVWSMGACLTYHDDPTGSPYAQMSVRPGFIFSPEGEFVKTLGTGNAPWEAKKLDGYTFVDSFPTWGTGANVDIDGSRFAWGFESGDGDGWGAVEALHEGANASIRNEVPPVHKMRPATLPPMDGEQMRVKSFRFASEVFTDDTRRVPVREADNIAGQLAYMGVLDSSGAITVPPNTTARAIVDLEEYYCAYPEIVVSGGKGSLVRILWAESLYNEPEGHTKGDRGKIDGKYFIGIGDTFRPDGGKHRRFDTLWWQAGRYIEVYVQTAGEPLTVESFTLTETRYPVEMESSFESSDERLARIVPIMLRGLQMCSHETYMDCPYYEQLQYVGDTRLQALTAYTLTHDDRLARKALRMFDASRLPSGITESRYPSRVRQVIPPFSLWWIGMVHDFALWRGDRSFVRSMMPGVRAVIDWYASHLSPGGLVQAPNGWNYMDWVPGWSWGIPPDGDKGVNGLVNWQFVLALAWAAELEDWVREPEMAERDRRMASELASCATEAFWDEGRGLLAEDLARKHFSEHTQCLALLSGQLGDEWRAKAAGRLLSDPDLYRATIYFTHYLFEACALLGSIETVFDRLGLWFELADLGLKTPIEMPEPTRSDCHGWGAHPLYHYFATILGIRPDSMGFETVRIEPRLGPLSWAKGSVVHPRGYVSVDLRMDGDQIRGTVELPEGVTGKLVRNGSETDLRPGRQEF